MSNYIEYENRIAFHPGYYIKEMIDESNFSQEDFAKKMDITVDELNVFAEGKLRMTEALAEKLAELLGTSKTYWMNLQKNYDAENQERNI